MTFQANSSELKLRPDCYSPCVGVGPKHHRKILYFIIQPAEPPGMPSGAPTIPIYLALPPAITISHAQGLKFGQI